MKLKKLFILLPLLLLVIILVGCGGSMNAENASKGTADIDAGYSKTYSNDIINEGGYDSTIQSGQLTGKAWRDNDNYDHWLDIITKDENSNNQKSLATSYNNFIRNTGKLESKNMLKVVVKSGNVVIENAKVLAFHGSDTTTLFSGVTDAFGEVFIFLPQALDTEIELNIIYDGVSYRQTVDAIPADRTINIDLGEISVLEKIKKLDLCLIVDTTGSMSDELEYLKVELRNVLENIAEQINYDIELALIFYRDEGDEYVTRVFEFTSDLNSQYQNLGAQSAKGGGDWPESVEVALNKANGLAWRSDSVKIILDVLDAPLHETIARCNAFADEVMRFASRGIRFIPIIASAKDSSYTTLLEFTMRSAAIYTGGTYTYLTNDSGIGNSHSNPDTSDDIVVEYLNLMLIRLIKQYCTGVHLDPKSYYKVDETQTAPDEVIVRFDSNSGSAVNPQIVKVGETVTKPADPVRDGFEFIDWYVKDTLQTSFEPYDFTQPVTEAMTLVALWRKAE